MKLVIVESPTKTKTVGKYLGNGFKIASSYGHVRDLPKSNKNAIDISGGFVPQYEIVPEKKKVISDLKKLVAKSDEVILATDPDREGEAIAWHLANALGLMRAKKPISRVVFHEITENAVLDAMKHPRDIDENLLRAQEARRVLDRIVGYDLSGLIWKKVRYGLSAGRVQSPALRILMEREREIRAFKPENYWVLSGDFSTKNGDRLELFCDEKPSNEDEAKRIENAARNGSWKISSVSATQAKRSPKAPLITSTLQQAASSRLGFSPKRTMSIAQKLYEQGHITYMRTDSVSISETVLGEIYGTIQKEFGDGYVSARSYKTKSKSAQEAHEAIRPTRIGVKVAGGTVDQKKLYTLIRERTLACQMADAKILRTKISADIGDDAVPKFSTTGSVVLFPGWLAADTRARGEETELPHVTEGEELKLIKFTSEGKQTEPPNRYTEAGLVKELEKREIGRPSTYASIIDTLEKRGYVDKLGRTLHPTDTGEVVSDFLEKYFGEYISDSFTAHMEDDLDGIANGEKKYKDVMDDFYVPFEKEVASKENIDKVTNLGNADEKFKCPVCDSPMVIKLGRSGKFLSCKKFPKCTGARKIDGTEMAAPKETGEDCPECDTGKLVEREGRYGVFVACSNYPKCKYVKSGEGNGNSTGVKCKKCGNGEIAERRGRFGPFYGCSNYPKCDFAMKAKPTGAECKICGALMMEGTKTIPERCSDKTCPNHNPHKTHNS